MTCVIDISLLQFGQLSIVGTTEHARLALMTLPFARQNVGASKRLTLDWVPVSLKSKSWNWLGRFATAARSPRLLCAYYPQESRKKLRQSDGRLAEARACSAPIESGGFSWGRGWERLSALIRFWEAGRCQRPILGRCGSERLRRSKVELRGARRPRNLRLVPAPQLSGSSAFGRRAAARPNRGAEAPHHWRSMRIFYWSD